MLVAAAGPGGAILWNVESGEVRTIKAYNAVTVALNHSNRWLAVGHAASDISLYDLSTGEKIRSFSSRLNTVFRIAFSPDTKKVAAEVAWVGRDTTGAYAEADRGVLVWEFESGQEVHKFGEEETGAPVFSADGHWLVHQYGLRNCQTSRNGNGKNYSHVASRISNRRTSPPQTGSQPKGGNQ